MRAYARRAISLFGGIGHFALVAGAGDQFERRDRREQAIGGIGVSIR